MSVPATNANSTAGADAAAKAQEAKKKQAEKSSTLNYDNFLRLLLAQMKNQDPTAPMKSTEYMGQLASFSQVEQSVNANNKLDSLLKSSSMTQAQGLVGRTITSADDKVSGKVTSVQVTDTGVVAHLDTGTDIPYGPGLKIS
ncbi:flagellar hook assembly protein FlgD [Methylobacterium brachiatum]|jgi:flagellar basal-body rod modification protein FlgD|uniref:Basal-body rod modification protein FlgD n=1 Tax=Methylobacterium brachiatum TaxID=269660 RepID=A0AAJ1TXM9_9HYPH|nr:flagellar hook assembly protein FlgD [Methylobacterium brachiatum]AYO81860.1 flagellar hook assembly protein FlgD [Methylobacterium brachiatum]MCB4804358.1 flagellar hook assembly protein FlgD [Methylobacterium brachiatum]MDH2312892.1 flagellar hook assembly protein FlgD [Methylobacterium brachiatum]MDQ0545387.1 flagellar basal-body rod modification protein FlgD [Methylobacterium brachiatum]